MVDITSLFEEYLGSPLPSAQPSVREGYLGGARADVGLTPEFTVQDLLNYGSSDPIATIARATGRSQYIDDASTDRTNAQVVGDTSVDIVNGLLQGAIGIGALGTGLVSDSGGAAVSEFGAGVNNFFQGLQSDELNARREAFGARNEITTEHNDRLEQQEIADGDSPLIAGLRKAGRNFIRGLTNQDLVTFGSGTASGVGSLLAGGVIGKGLRALGLGRASMPTAIGMLEGGGAYQQTVNEVLGMDHDQLIQTSPEYAEMIRNGIPWEEARNTIANEAGLMAGAIQAPVGVATGTLVSKFEGAPFAVGSIRDAASNILRETVEEGIQSGSGEFTSNLGIQTFADENRRLDEGVGGATAEGALYGMGTAGAVQAPRVAVETPIRAAKATGKFVWEGIRKAGSSLRERGEQIIADIEKASPVSAEAIEEQAANVSAMASLPDIREDLYESIASSAENEQEAAEAREYIDRVFSRIQLDPGEAETELPVIQEALANSTDRFDAMKQVSAIAADESRDIYERIDAGIYLLRANEQHQDLFYRDLPTAISRARDDDPSLAPLREFEDVILNIQQHPEIQKVLRQSQAIIEKMKAEDMASNPQAVETALKVAEMLPEQANLDVTQEALKHASNLPPERRAQLEATVEMLKVAQQHAAEKEVPNSIQGKITPNVVSEQILTFEDDPKSKVKSGASHFAGIMQALRTNNRPLAADRLKDFMMFAQHMANKVQAINENYRTGNGSRQNDTKYQALTSARQWLPSKTGLWINPAAPKSVAQAKLVESEARAIIRLANRIAAINPDLGIEPLAEASLDPALQGSIEEIVQSHRIQRGNRSSQGAPEEIQSERGPAPDEAPSVEAKAEPVSPEPVEAAPEITVESYVDAYMRGEGRDDPAMEQFAINNSGAIEAEFQRRKEILDAQTRSQPQSETSEISDTSEATAEPEQVQEEPELELTEEQQITPEVEETSEELVLDEPITPVEPKTAAEAWPNLIDSDHTPNWFRRAFRLPRTRVSRLLGLENPVLAVREALQSQKSAEKFVGRKLNNRIKPEAVRAFDLMIQAHGRVYAEMRATLDRLLAEKTKGQTFEQALLNGNPDGNPINTLKRARILNLVQVEDDKIVYDENLLGGALLAGVNWLLNAGQQSRRYDDEAISRIIHGVPDGEVSTADRDFFNSTLYFNDTLNALSSAIVRYWGVSANPKAETGHTKGIPEAIAKDLFNAYHKLGLIEIVSHHVGTGDNRKSYNGIIVNIPEQIIDGTKGFPDLIEHLVAVEPEETIHIGTPPPAHTQQKLAGKMRALPKQQQEAARTESETPHRLNMPMLDLISGLGRDLTLRLFGHSDFNDRQNKNHRKSMEGFNRTITGAFDYMSSLAEQVRNRAEVAGQSLEEMPIFFGYEFSRVNRMHMQGRYNPQANKLMRELVMPTQSVIDLSSETGPDYNRFMLAIAQHLGEKVHRLGREVSVAKAREALDTQYARSVTLLRDWVKRNGSNKPLKLTAADIDTLLEEFGAKPAPGAIHAVLDYARYLEADSDTRQEFSTSLYIEADGITDGPVNAMMHLTTGPFSLHWLRMMAKGGLYLGSRFKTLANYVASGEPGSDNDLYQAATIGLQRALMADRVKRDGDERVAQQRWALLFALDMLDKDVRFDIEQDILAMNSSLEFDRGIAKNPMTVTVYGSGTAGIANKIVHGLVSKIYEQMSTGELDPTLVRALNQLTNRKAVIGKRGKNTDKMFIIDQPSGGRTMDKSTFADYTFNKIQLQNLSDNVLNLFVLPLNEGIQQVIGEVNTGKEALQSAIQVQSVILQDAFRSRIQERLQEKRAKDPNWATHQSLSQSELDEVHAEVVEEFSGLIPTGTQIFYPAATENFDITDPASSRRERIELSRSSDDDLGTPQLITGPGDAGVRGIPYMVIGPGDGQMVQNTITSPDRPQGALYVFDGVNLKLTTVEQDSEVINRAVYDGWLQGNPLDATAKSFRKFAEAIQDHDLEGLSDQAIEALERTLGPAENANEIVDQVINLAGQLEELALQNQARKNVLGRVNLSVDHMASAESPFSVTGKIDPGASFEEQVETLNRFYQEELAKLRGLEIPALEEIPNTARITPAAEMGKLFRELDFPAEQIPLLNEVARIAARSGWSIVTGSRDQIAHFLRTERPRSDVDAHEKGLHGVIHPETREIIILDPTAETVLHETIHAATYGLFQQFYANPESLTTEQQEAIRRIELLANEFYQLREPTDAYVDAYEAMEEHLQKGNQAAALNEFMAWVLANRELRTLTRNTKVKNPLARIALDAFLALKRLFWGSNAPKVADDLLSNLEFNTRVLTASILSDQASPSEIIGQNLRHQSSHFGQNARLRDLRVRFARKIAHLVQDQPIDRRLANKTDIKRAVRLADEVLEGFTVKGFQMTPEESSTFQMLVAAFATQAELDNNALARIEQIYSQVVKNLSVEDFMVSDENDFEAVRDQDRYYAQEKFNAIMGIGTARIDHHER
jgi:hypothetical protein